MFLSILRHKKTRNVYVCKYRGNTTIVAEHNKQSRPLKRGRPWCFCDELVYMLIICVSA